jgi:hypothetical protein
MLRFERSDELAFDWGNHTLTPVPTSAHIHPQLMQTNVDGETVEYREMNIRDHESRAFGRLVKGPTRPGGRSHTHAALQSVRPEPTKCRASHCDPGRSGGRCEDIAQTVPGHIAYVHEDETWQLRIVRYRAPPLPGTGEMMCL